MEVEATAADEEEDAPPLRCCCWEKDFVD